MLCVNEVLVEAPSLIGLDIYINREGMPLFKSIINYFTPKDWKYFNKESCINGLMFKVDVYQYRCCSRTGLFQKRPEGWFDINKGWVTLDYKPHFVFKNGEWRVKE